jgi:uncharacterized protein YjiS (DUF1127 family)
MMTVISRLKSAAAKRAAYKRTVAELEAMPLDVALDLDLFREDARRIARHAVYGG